MAVGYLMNSYPMVSTTFIGREIEAIEALGEPIVRYAVRPWDGPLVDPHDIAEQGRTRYLLTGSPLALAGAVVAELFGNTRGVLRTLGLLGRLISDAGGEVVRHAAYMAEAMLLKRLCMRDGVSILHAHFSSNATTVAMLAQSLGGPDYGFTVHGPTDFYTPFSGSLGLKVARARYVACISHFCRSQVMLFSDRAHWGKLAIVHCGVDPALYDAAPQVSYGKTLLFVGRLAVVKGVAVLLEAMRTVIARHPDARLVLVGDGPERPALEAEAKALGLGGHIEFAGYRTQAQVAGHLAACDLFVLPSFAEGVPVVLMEAMASRRAVVATRVAGVAELVEDGVAGALVPPGDPVALAARIGALLDDPGLRARMGEAGRAKVVAEFDAAHEAAWLLRILRAHRLGGKVPGLRPAESVAGTTA
jgi:glycosyltransferase involved in cell wall biosynthesis